MKHLRLTRIGLAVALAALWFGGVQATVHAEGQDEYPFAEVACVHAPYAVTDTQAKWCANYDWGIIRGNASTVSSISPYGYAYRNCTDYAAWRLDQAGVVPAAYTGLGNANTWGQRAAGKGIVVNAVPSTLAIAVRTTGEYGHVAVVEEVDMPGHPAGSIRISQYNKQATGVFSTQIGTPAELGFTQFIHFIEVSPATAVLTTSPEPVPAVSALPTEPEKPLMSPDSAPSEAPPLLAPSMTTDTSAAQPKQVQSPQVPDPEIRASLPILQLPEQAPWPVAQITPRPLPTPPLTGSNIPAVATQPSVPVPNRWWRTMAEPPPTIRAIAPPSVSRLTVLAKPASLWLVLTLLALYTLWSVINPTLAHVRLLTAIFMVKLHTRRTI